MRLFSTLCVVLAISIQMFNCATIASKVNKMELPQMDQIMENIHNIKELTEEIEQQNKAEEIKNAVEEAEITAQEQQATGEEIIDDEDKLVVLGKHEKQKVSKR